MSGRFEVELVTTILDEHFGPSVATVGALLAREPSTLPQLVVGLRGKMKLLMIRKALVVLERFGMVGFVLDGSMKIVYSLNSNAVLNMLKASRCVLIAKTLYGNEADVIVQELICRGRMSCSETIRTVAKKLEDSSLVSIKEVFCRLAESQFIARCPPVESTLKGCPQFSNSYDPFIMPDDINLDEHRAETAGSRKRKAEMPDTDAEILWRINWTRFDRYVRDELVSDVLISNNLASGERATEICRSTIQALLRAGETRASAITMRGSAPVSVMDVLRWTKANNVEIERPDLEWALRILVEDGRGVLRRAGDSGGGLFVVDFERAVDLLCQNHMEALIREQLDTKAVRIFRLLDKKGYLEEEQIEKLSMTNAKQTRELIYALLEEGYIFNRPVGRTNDFAPARTFYLYYVDRVKTCRSIVEYTCKMLRNVIVRRNFETEENKRIIESEQSVKMIAYDIKNDPEKDDETKELEIAEVYDTYLPPTDRKKLEEYHNANSKLMIAESELERTLFALKLKIELSMK